MQQTGLEGIQEQLCLEREGEPRKESLGTGNLRKNWECPNYSSPKIN